MRPIVVITMGDPCGVGPEIIVKAFDSPHFLNECSAVVVGAKLPLDRAIGLLGLSASVRPITFQTMTSLRSDTSFNRPGLIPLLDPASLPNDRPGIPDPLFQVSGCRSGCELSADDIEFGRPSPAVCESVISWIKNGVEFVRAGLADAVCTCPINKEQLHGQGFPFPGHTEFIRELTLAADAVMMLAGPRLKVALATIHEPLEKVPGLITKELLRKVISITAESMFRDFAVPSPRIAVAGLNPHAGEAGRFGREEIEVIRPVIEEFEAVSGFSLKPVHDGSSPMLETASSSHLTKRNCGECPDDKESRNGFSARISGPWPADTVFNRTMSGEFDAVVAMYHDQGLIPVKLVHFNEAVNVSLGLPIIRTSVDHGTAYDIAGSGLADAGSLIEAVRLASTIARNRIRTETKGHTVK